MQERILQTPQMAEHSNDFTVLSNPETPALEEGEIQPLVGQVEVPVLFLGVLEQVSSLEPIRYIEHLTSLEGAKSPPSSLGRSRLFVLILLMMTPFLISPKTLKEFKEGVL